MAARITAGARGAQTNNGGNAAIISASETNAGLKTGKGVLGRVFVTNVGSTATLKVYDDPTTSNNQLVDWASADGKVNWELNIPFTTGLTVITAGSTACTAVILWE